MRKSDTSLDIPHDLMQNMEYKFVELMSLQYARSPEDTVQHQITYRYNAMKVRCAARNASLVAS